jgi:hypothetical protein
MKKSLILTLLAGLALVLSVSFASAQGDSENLFTKVVTIDSTKIKTSFTTEVVLVKAPNSDYVVVPVSIVTEFVYKDAYSDAGGASQISYAGSSTALASLSTILAGTAYNIRVDGLTAASFAATAIRGKDLVYKHTVANPTGGRSSLRIRIAYRLVPLYKQ